MKTKNHLQLKLTLIFYLACSLLRIASATLPFFPMGFSPMASISLFSTRLIHKRWIAYLFPLIIMVSTDSFINFFFTRQFSPFYPGFYWQYLSFFLVTILGQFFFLTKDPLSFKRVLLASVSAASLFFLISNLGVFLENSLYPMSLEGFIRCYVLALPFYAKDLGATLFFSTLIYSSGLAIYGQSESKIKGENNHAKTQ